MKKISLTANRGVITFMLLDYLIEFVQEISKFWLKIFCSFTESDP